MSSYINKFYSSVSTGCKKGWSGFLWMVQIIVPVSLLTSLLIYSSWLNHINFLITPVLGILKLPAIAALPLMAGMLTGIYGGIASMALLPLTENQQILIAIFLLISHGLIHEGVVQAKSGINPIKATLFRLIASVITVFFVAHILQPEEVPAITAAGAAADPQVAFTSMLTKWGYTTLNLCVKMFVIFILLRVVLEIMRSFKLLPPILKLITPVLKFHGLKPKVDLLWLTSTLFGLTIGGAIIMEEIKERDDLSEKELTRLHLSMGINHAIIEDPGIFIVLGLNPFWLLIPRFSAAILAVHLFNLYYYFRLRNRWFTLSKIRS